MNSYACNIHVMLLAFACMPVTSVACPLGGGALYIFIELLFEVYVLFVSNYHVECGKLEYQPA